MKTTWLQGRQRKNLLGSDPVFPVFINPVTPYDSVVRSYLAKQSERKSFLWNDYIFALKDKAVWIVP